NLATKRDLDDATPTSCAPLRGSGRFTSDVRATPLTPAALSRYAMSANIRPAVALGLEAFCNSWPEGRCWERPEELLQFLLDRRRISTCTGRVCQLATDVFEPLANRHNIAIRKCALKP